MNKSFLSRIGTFFILIGCGLFIIFIASVLAMDFNILYLLSAGVAFFLAFVSHRAAPRSEPARFSSIRRARERSRQRREEKQNQKDQKNGQTYPDN